MAKELRQNLNCQVIINIKPYLSVTRVTSVRTAKIMRKMGICRWKWYCGNALKDIVGYFRMIIDLTHEPVSGSPAHSPEPPHLSAHRH